MHVALAMGAVAVLSTVLSYGWRRYARHRAWLDIPNHRSSHVQPTPSSGGVGFAGAFFVYVLGQYLAGELSVDWMMPLSLGLILAVVGFIDDRRNLDFRFRLGTQVAVVMLLWPFFSTLPPLILWGGYHVQGVALIALLSIALLWLINLFNFMDGIDGLAASEGIFCLCAFMLFNVSPGFDIMPIATMVSALVGFLVYNKPKASLFMGDVGSYFVGFVVGVAGLLLVRDGGLGYWTAFIALATFTADSTTTLIGRLRTKGLWYHPHRTHAYQLLARHWHSHGRVGALYLAVNVLWVAPLAGIAQLHPEIGFWVALVAWLPLVVAATVVRARFVTEDSLS